MIGLIWLIGIIPALAVGGHWLGQRWIMVRERRDYDGEDKVLTIGLWALLIFIFVSIWPIAGVLLFFARVGARKGNQLAETERLLAEANEQVIRLKREGQL